MSRPGFLATARFELAPRAAPQSSVTLDAAGGLRFRRASVNGRSVAFAHDPVAARITIEFPKTFARSELFTLELEYTTNSHGGKGEGLTWSGDDPRTPETDFMLHAQGQPQSNSRWFPCHDFPNLRVPTSVTVTVPEPYEAVSNGTLQGVSRAPISSIDGVWQQVHGDAPAPPTSEAAEAEEITDNDDETPPKSAAATSSPKEAPATHVRTFRWSQTKPHPYYLVTLVVSRFEVVNVGGPASAYPGLWMPVYGPLGSGEQMKRVFGNTAAMIAHFEKLFDCPFPWDKYAQILCRDFTAGAMENTSAVTFNASLARGGGRRGGSIDNIIAHELVHHWFGNYVTPRSWQHLWISEGMATFGEALWAEHVGGERAYRQAILSNVNTERAMSRRRSAPRQVGMVSHLYSNPDQRFISGDNVYSKGGVVLHMLRMRLGDDAFFAGLRLFLKRHALQQVETDDLRLVFEEVSGQSLQRFFDQWCLRPGHPSIEVDLVFTQNSSEDGGELRARLEQTQTIDANNPAFAIELPMFVRFSSDPQDGEWITVLMDERIASTTVQLPRKPVEVRLDPNTTVLARTRIRTPLHTQPAGEPEVKP